jgi:hypothetical protein
VAEAITLHPSIRQSIARRSPLERFVCDGPESRDDPTLRFDQVGGAVKNWLLDARSGRRKPSNEGDIPMRPVAIVFGLILLLGTGWLGTAFAITGLSPAIDGSLGCTAGTSSDPVACADTYEVRCTQPSAILCVEIIDSGGTDDCIQLSLVGVAPTGIYGHSAQDLYGACATILSGFTCLSKPGTEGTMKALASVWNDALVHNNSPYDYTIRAFCHSFVAGADRTTSLVLKENH